MYSYGKEADLQKDLTNKTKKNHNQLQSHDVFM